MNKNVVKIAVMDVGIGFRKSLSHRFKLKGDLDAIDHALLHGASRYEDEGRGHGLAAVRRFVDQWQGKLSIRSGTARLSIIPPWARGMEQERNLISFPGSQINIHAAGSVIYSRNTIVASFPKGSIGNPGYIFFRPCPLQSIRA